jgi:hypothetical protein
MTIAGEDGMMLAKITGMTNQQSSEWRTLQTQLKHLVAGVWTTIVYKDHLPGGRIVERLEASD